MSPKSSWVLATVLVVTGGLQGAVSPAQAGNAPLAAHGSLFVSVHGQDAAAGTSLHPLRSIQTAVDRVPPGGTIIVGPGRYHETVTLYNKDGVTIRAARPGSVWLDGSSRVRRWHQSGRHVWVRAHWHHEFNSSPTFNWNAPDNTQQYWQFVNPRHPMAAHPDQVFVDGHSLRQVARLGAVRRGRFFVDYGSHRLYIGTDPRGHDVRASTIAKAITIQSSGVTIAGINVEAYAPSVPAMGSVTVERTHVTLSHMLIRDMATTGLFVGAADSRLDHVTVLHNGLLGLLATYADRLHVLHMTSAGNNSELFNMAPAAGGAKIGRSTGVVIRDSRFVHNHGTGLWFDESCYRLSVLASRFLDNANHGMSVEVSGHATVAGNVIAHNAGNGVKINDSDNVEVWNNTFVGNDEPIAVLQDNRDQDAGGVYHDTSLPLPWVNRHITVQNNIIAHAGRGSSCLLCVIDYTHRFSAADLDLVVNGDVLQRRDRRTPFMTVIWPLTKQSSVGFPTAGSFVKASGQELSHLALTGKAAVTHTFQPTTRVRQEAATVARPLPEWLASVAHRTVGERTLGAWSGR